MSNITEEVELETAILREAGITEKLRIVPYIHKRCFIPCPLGMCNCHPTIQKRFCLVTQSAYKSCIQDSNEELQYIEKLIP